jgi:modulator of FtsH protease HflC
VEVTKAVDQVDIKVSNSITDELKATGAVAPAEVIRRAGFGIEIVDVRMMRTDLPKETSTPIYNRMRSDRQKVAERFRAEGQKESQIIRSVADKERTILLAEAERKSATIRGLGDAEATRIFAESFGQDVDFFEFYRALEAYREALNKDDTTVILSPEHEFLKFLNP